MSPILRTQSRGSHASPPSLAVQAIPVHGRRHGRQSRRQPVAIRLMRAGRSGGTALPAGRIGRSVVPAVLQPAPAWLIASAAAIAAAALTGTVPVLRYRKPAS